MKQRIKDLAKQYLPQIIEIRRHIHAHPELSFQEYNTAQFIASQLKQWKIPYKEGIAKTGIVALLEGKNSQKKTIALRADIDALPITETKKIPYKSKHQGIMHACGHDVHTASLLGAIAILNQLKSEWEGTIKLIFQPGEEKLPGGASLMIKEGVLKNPDPSAIFAQHVFPSLETGKVGFREGIYMASTDEIYIRVKGKGGHAALPNQYINPILIASEIIRELHSRFMDEETRNIPDIPTVLAFGKFLAEGATNVIPGEVKLEGTFRTMDESWRSKAHSIIAKIAESVAKQSGGSCVIDIRKGYPVLINHEKLTARARKAAEDYLGKENLENLDLRMTAEDFAYYGHEIPGCFYRLGTGNKAKGIVSNVHTSTFDIDENALEVGMGLMAWLAINELTTT